MQATTLTKISLISICVAIGVMRAPIAQAQLTPSKPAGLPTVTAPQPPQIVPNSTTSPTQSSPITASTISVKCKNLSTVVQKGDRRASLFNWRTNYFAADYTPDKRCQMVSARLQAVANLNGGTLKGLQLGSGTLNRQVVICVLQTGENNCTDRNLLFTLKPENAKRPEAIIAKILTFAEDGSTSIDESARPTSKSGVDLGSWERRAFPESKKSRTRNPNTGF
jgi:Circadian oscillating protein COP23